MGKPRKNSKDPALDLRYTPGYASTPLMKLLNLHEDSFIWEPASGNGDLLSAMMERSPATFWGTELSDGQDFFHKTSIPKEFYEDPEDVSSGIITNPPYSIKPEWLSHCFEVTENVALLLPVESLASSKLRKIWNDNNGVSILLFDCRVDFRGEGGKWFESNSNVSTAWFISGFNIKPDRIIQSSIKEEKSDFKKSCRFLNI